MRCLKIVVWIAWWIARPHIGNHKALQHWEISLSMELQPISKWDPHLHRVRRGSLFIGGELVLQHGVDLETTMLVDDLIDEIDNRPEGQGDRT